MSESEVRVRLLKIAHEIANVLGENFIGFYLSGSFVMGAWNPQTSDLDFLVVTRQPLNANEDAILQQLHAELAREEPGRRLEGEYIDLSNLRQKNFALLLGTVRNGLYYPAHPCQLSADNILCLVQYGQCILGAPVEQLAVEVSIQELKEAAYEMLREDHQEFAMTSDFARRAYLLIDSLRCIYALRTGRLPTKASAIEANRDLLSESLYRELTAYQQGALSCFDIPEAVVQTICQYGLALGQD